MTKKELQHQFDQLCHTGHGGLIDYKHWMEMANDRWEASLDEIETLKETIDSLTRKLEIAEGALEGVVDDVKQMDGTCPYKTWAEAREALKEIRG
jgi:uncharacterized protein with HEPN domain